MKHGDTVARKHSSDTTAKEAEGGEAPVQAGEVGFEGFELHKCSSSMLRRQKG